jgi:hypothetical protein
VVLERRKVGGEVLRVNVYDESCVQFCKRENRKTGPETKKKETKTHRQTLQTSQIDSGSVMRVKEWGNIGKSTRWERMPVKDCGMEVQPIIPASHQSELNYLPPLM